MYFTDRNQHAILLFIKANTMPPSFLYYQLVSNLMHDIPNNQHLEIYRTYLKRPMIFMFIFKIFKIFISKFQT